jgi:hypothetical protein
MVWDLEFCVDESSSPRVTGLQLLQKHEKATSQARTAYSRRLFARIVSLAVERGTP